MIIESLTIDELGSAGDLSLVKWESVYQGKSRYPWKPGALSHTVTS